MTELDFSFWMTNRRADEGNGLKALVHGLQKLQNLTELALEINTYKWTDFSGALNQLFDKFTKLTDVDITSANDVNQCLDAGVATLVRQNPGLQNLTLTCHYHRYKGMVLSDDALTSLSSLRHLTRLDIDNNAVFSVDAILSLLRGNSRTMLRFFALSHEQKTDWTSVRAEINEIAHETGQIFRVEVGDESIRCESI